jgi:Tol biopolymer transport system component
MWGRLQSVASILRSTVLIGLLVLMAGCGGGTGGGGTGGGGTGGGGTGGGTGGGGGGGASSNAAYLTWTSGTGFSLYYYQINLMSSTGVTPVGSPDTWASVRLSPDGKTIVFSLYDQWFRVGVMNADGSGKTILTPFGQSLYPAFTPDGTKILYQYLSGPALYRNYDLILMNADGTNPINLTNQNGTSYLNPVISPDGKTIAVEVEGANGGLATMNIDGSGFKVIAQGKFSWPAFGADGSKIFVTYSSGSGDDINVIDLDGTNKRALTTSNYDECPVVVGNKVVFMSTRDSQTHSASDSEIYEMNPDGSGITRLTNNTVYDGFYDFGFWPI